MNSNEKFVLVLCLGACVFGLSILFMPDNKAALYIAIPSSLAGGAMAHLGIKNRDY